MDTIPVWSYCHCAMPGGTDDRGAVKKRHRLSVRTRRFIAYLLAPSAVAGIFGFIGGRVADLGMGIIQSNVDRENDTLKEQLKEVRDILVDLAKTPPTTAAEAERQRQLVARFAKIFGPEANSLLLAWEKDLATQEDQLRAAEKAEEERRKQEADSRATRDAAAARAHAEAARLAGDRAASARREAQEAARRSIERSTRLRGIK